MKINSILSEALKPGTAQEQPSQMSAGQQYANISAQVAAKLQAIQQAFVEHNKRAATDPRNWGFSGDLEHIASQLDDVLQTLTS